MKTITAIIPQQDNLPIQPETWHKATRLLIKKMIAEFAHEQILRPVLESDKDGWGQYVLKTDNTSIEYRFNAKILSLHHWLIDTDSIEKIVNGDTAMLDAARFIIECKQAIGIDPALLPVYLEEVAGTLYGSAYILSNNRLTSRDLAQAGYQEIERSMTGHPRFIPNNGRVGFDVTDYRQYAPEAATPLSLIWIAGHKSMAEFTSAAHLAYEQVLEQELSPSTIRCFQALLKERGLDPENYYYMPVHPWQWYNKLINLFAQDIAAGLLVCLGYSEDKYLPQQSIRTFFITSNPHKYYVKTALGILNMGYIRILSPYFMRTTPAINEWVYAIVEGDTYLQDHGFCILRELAAIGYTNQYYEQALKEDSPYKKMLASLWRESPMSKLRPGQRLMTMAALLHTDTRGEALLPELIRASGLSTSAWIQQYLHCYLNPLLHCFYQYDMVFMPHGENLVLVMENHVPVRAIMKDIGEEVSILNMQLELPEKVKRIQVAVPEALKTRPLFTQLFDSIFRFIAAILVEHSDYPEEKFWELVANCILKYQQQHPTLAGKFKQYDLFVPTITPDALNRMQILDNKKLRDRANPFDVPTTGILTNPIAPFNTSLL
jgi:siderophore synthetase component